MRKKGGDKSSTNHKKPYEGYGGNYEEYGNTPDESYGNIPDVNDGGYENAPYGNRGNYDDAPYGNGGSYGNAPYGNSGGYDSAPYGNSGGYDNAPYGNNGGYGNTSYGNSGGYGNTPYGNSDGYGNASYGNSGGYGNAPYGNNGDYGNAPYGGNGDYGNAPYENYGGYDNAPYENYSGSGGGYYGPQNGNGNGGGDYHPQNGNDNGPGKKPHSQKKRSRAGDVISIAVMVVAFCVFVFSGYMLYGYYREYKKVDDEYANLATYTTDETETEDLDALEAAVENEDAQSISGREVRTVEVEEEEVSLPVMTNPIDFESLKEVNSDIVGWLKIRALDLSYPVVQGEDNDYYLHRSFEQEELFSGCLFVNYTNNSDFSDQNTIIYGHNMKNGSMFGTLKNFRDEEVYEKSKYFWVFTEDIIYQYRIVSARVVNNVGQTYQTVFSDEEFQEFLDEMMENSEVDNSGVFVSTEDKFVTLSTCTGDSSTRFVVQGKLVQMYASKEQ